jgi:hypothetical protein
MKWDLLKKFLVFSSEHTGKYKTSLFFESLRDVYKYNISILEYFQFGFYSMSESEKKKWAGTGTMYEFQKTSNPVNERKILDDKRLFYQNYKEFFIHELYTLEDLANNESLVKELLSSSKKLVVKESSGKAGVGVEIIETKELKGSDVISIMKKNGFGILETYINQHSSIHQLSPSGVNTIRIFTQIRKDGTYEVLGCRMRISVDSPVDNMAAGNLAVPLDEITGIINGPGVYSDITKAPESIHPITRVSIIGFQIPFWKEILEMTKKASLKHPQNRSIGWDIVVTENGPGFIEGNHDWCKLVWQLPVNKGLKYRLDV